MSDEKRRAKSARLFEHLAGSVRALHTLFRDLLTNLQTWFPIVVLNTTQARDNVHKLANNVQALSLRVDITNELMFELLKSPEHRDQAKISALHDRLELEAHGER